MSADRYIERLDAYTAGRDPLALQRETIGLLRAALAGLAADEARRRPAPGKWSIVEIVAHMAEDELVSSWRYRQMLERPGCELAGFEQDLWATLGDYGSWSLEDAFSLFRLLREANLRLLERLSAERLEAHGVHGERGRMTVGQLARHMAGHDRNHLEQIEGIRNAHP